MTQGKRGGGSKHQLLWEEVPYLKVERTGKPCALYKREDVQKELPVEERNYYAHFPIRGTRGKRMSLLVSARDEALMRVQEEAVNLRVQLAQGVTVVIKTTVADLVTKFLASKKSRIRGEWEGKGEAGRKSITKERYALIEGKIRNYLVPFLGAKADAKSIPHKKWSEWETWRRQNVRRGGAPKADTLLNEMGHIRECWKFGMEQGLIPFAPVLPFHDENLVTDDKVRRETWELDEWNSFKSLPSKWLREQEGKSENEYWDCFVAYQMLFFLSNNGMRVGEVVKLKRRDIRFYERKLGDKTIPFKRLGALVQVHKSTKTGAREVNSMGGEFSMRVFEKAPHKKKEDFLFQHLDGSPFTTRQFSTIFRRIIIYTDQESKTGKHLVVYSLRHLYATTRLQHGTSHNALCENMGVGESYLKKHYSHYLPRLATEDLTRMRSDIGLDGRFLHEGEDFAVMDVEDAKCPSF